MGKRLAFSGMLRVSVESADLPGLMGALNHRGITLYSAVFQDDVTLVMEIHRRDWRKLWKICKTRGEKLRIQKHLGLYWSAKKLKSRPVLLMGMVFLLFLILFIPSRVLFIRVEGNRNVPANQILEAAENCGISFGVSRRSVRSERVKNKLLESMPQLQWAGINTKGCVAVVSVRERKSESSDEAEGFVSGIVAVRDGVIQSCTATRGNLLCAPGQAVRKGELLISGFTDCGLTILESSAEGEVFALTRQSACAVTPLTCLKKGSHGPSRRKYSLILGKKRINLWKDSGIWVTSCGRIYSEYYVTLPGGLVLPLAFAVEEIRPVDLQEREILPEEAEVLLKAQLTGYLTGQMIAGQVISREEMLSGSGVYKLAGEYVCTEMIGREQREQIGE